MTKPGPHHELAKNDDLELRIIEAKPLSLATPRRPSENRDARETNLDRRAQDVAVGAGRGSLYRPVRKQSVPDGGSLLGQRPLDRTGRR